MSHDPLRSRPSPDAWEPLDRPTDEAADIFLRRAGELDDALLDDALLDEDFPLGDGTADDSGVVYCPYCGEPAEVSLDAGGGAVQQYVEDCPVCCRPWQLTVRYDASGAATVECEAGDPD